MIRCSGGGCEKTAHARGMCPMHYQRWRHTGDARLTDLAPPVAPKITVACICGHEFETTQARVDDGRGRFCSKACQYANATRPTGLIYVKHKDNPTSFQPGHDRNLTGEAHPFWRGDAVGYQALHRWVRKVRGRPGPCEHCGTVDDTQWANRSHEYMREPDDWLSLCRKCHGAYDSGNARGSGVAKYGARNMRGYAR